MGSLITVKTCLGLRKWRNELLALEFPIGFVFLFSLSALFIVLLPKLCPLGPPTQTNPLLNVVGQASPQYLHTYLEQPPQSKLTQSDFLLDPGIRKFSHGPSLPINLFCLFRLHLLLMGNDYRIIHSTHNRSSHRFILRTTLLLKNALLTIGR